MTCRLCDRLFSGIGFAGRLASVGALCMSQHPVVASGAVQAVACIFLIAFVEKSLEMC